MYFWDGGEVENKDLVLFVPCWLKLAVVANKKADISGYVDPTLPGYNYPSFYNNCRNPRALIG